MAGQASQGAVAGAPVPGADPCRSLPTHDPQGIDPEQGNPPLRWFSMGLRTRKNLSPDQSELLDAPGAIAKTPVGHGAGQARRSVWCRALRGVGAAWILSASAALSTGPGLALRYVGANLAAFGQIGGWSGTELPALIQIIVGLVVLAVVILARLRLHGAIRENDVIGQTLQKTPAQAALPV